MRQDLSSVVAEQVFEADDFVQGGQVVDAGGDGQAVGC